VPEDAETIMVELSRYSLDLVREDAEFILYRAHSKQLEPPSILLLTPSSSRPSPETLEKINHEYSLSSELDNLWALQPLAISSYNDKRVLVLEDPGGVPLHRLVEGPMEIKLFLRFAIQISDAVGQLHRRRLIHKDLKPSNVFVALESGRVWLTGFGIASRLARERQPLEPPEFIAGTLPYMAPEQTGRMNRSIDSRSDLYALGVTLYEILTGRLPFAASDPTEWVHCHIARQPIPPAERMPNIPRPVSAIVMKLLAKTAEERYQTALGLERDLQRCLAEWETQHRIAEFLLGEHDIPDRLLIPEKLYGRESEIKTLLAAFDRIVGGDRPELVLVSGYSGIGKSSIVNELYKSLVPPRGLFTSGKFDQYKRDIPYATLAQAFQSLLRQLLTKSEAELHKWRDALHEALGPNGQLIVDLVPELKLIIGEQPPAPELPPSDAQGRFQRVFRRFIGVFARPEHPLALFLDDLQWLDAATLDLLEDLLTRPDAWHLLLIGAYRDNEVNPSHSLMRKLEAIRQAGTIVHNIVLAPLGREDIRQLVADSLHCELERATSLAKVIHEKTNGNPFFAIQFFSALADQALLTFDHGEGRWSWDLGRIHAKGYTDNVADLMVGKLSRLPVETQNALKQLACLGNSAEFGMLRMLYEDSNEEMHAQLWEGVRAGLIFRSEDSYRFLHDRVQEAAYSLIPQELRNEAHLRIGRLLFARTPREKREDRIFEIVNQFNRCVPLITSPRECEQVAELNLIAGKRAQASTAYTSALTFFTAGASLLLDNRWEQLHQLMFQLELHRAECEFLTGQLRAAEERLIVLSSRVANTVERAALTCLRADLYTALNQSDRAVVVCLEYLRHVDIEWTAHPTPEDARWQYDRIWSQLGDRPIEQVIELPLMNDPAALATLDVLTKILIPALFTDANLLSLAICTAVNLSLERGNSDASCVAYVWLGQIAGPRFGSYEAGFRFGQLGYDLIERRGLARFHARTTMVFASHVMPWTKHVRAGRELLRRAFETANKIGDITFAAYSRINLNTNLLIAGDLLAEVQQEAMNGLQYVQKVRFGLAIDHIRSQLGLICTLRGLTRKFGSFNDDQFDEVEFERHLASDPSLAQSECLYWIRKLQARFLAGDYASALNASGRARRLLWSIPSNLEAADYHFYSAFSHAVSLDSESPEQRQKHFEALEAHHKQLEIWAEHCPENFENREALVAAEIARIEGRLLDAEQLYEKAIRSAHTNGFIHNEALANEIAARFYLTRGFEKIAYTYLRDARYGYSRWGATAKLHQLDELYPQLRDEKSLTGSATTIGAPVELLDLGTIIKVSQAVSAEMVLERLIDTLMRTAIEHAGAERGLLILQRGDELRIEAEGRISDDRVIVRPKQAPLNEAPESILHYVTRTREHVILDDAVANSSFSTDAYIRQRHARSILCLPLINQAKLIGVLYLENNLAPQAFTPNRIAVLQLLASQAAVSLENVIESRRADEERERLRRTQAELEQMSRVSTLGELTASLAHEIKQPIGAAVTNAEACMRLLHRDQPDIDEARAAALEMAKDAKRAADIIDRVRSLFQKGTSQRDVVDVNEVIEEMVVMLQNEAKEHSVALCTDLFEGLPSVMADRVQLQQVLMNLMLNGIEAMQDTVGELSIKSQLGDDGQLLISVADTGMGLPAGKIDRLFDAFFTTKSQGTGLGLAITRSIVESHGGRIWATSNSGRGATFKFTLPSTLAAAA
jgi:predicted ATPase/signal transduction histidine kinase